MNIIYRIKYRSFFNFLFFACCALFLTFVSCKKDVNTVIGKNAQPSGINAKFATDDSTASLYLTTYTVEDVPSVTSGRSSYALGSYYDETFGTLTANLITQLYDYNPSDSLNSIYGIDSVVLFLVYKDAYPFKEGNELKPITISIGELLEPVTIDSSSAAANYYSNEDRTQNSGSILSHKSVPLNYLLDSVVNPSDSTSKIVQPILRIRLDENNPNGTDYAWKLLTASQNASTINNFLTAIPGLYFESHPALSTNDGNIVNFNFYSDYGSPGIRVYYKKTAGDTMSSEKTYTFSFSGGMTYNYLNIDRSTASPDLVSQINGDTTSGAKTLFLQSFYGSFIRLKMPNIRDFANIANGKRIVINQASLVMNVKPNATFPPASSLNIGYVKSNDTVIALSDQTLSIGGTYNESKSEYRLYLTRHIQNLLLNAENVPLTIYSNTRSSLPDITTIYGPDKATNGDKRMRLEIAYTILPE